MNVYERCPTYTTPRFVIRQVEMNDAPGLLQVYSDVLAQAYFNADNCTSDFRYATLTEMKECIRMWLWSYRQGHFVRWTVLHRDKPIGTVEMFRRESTDAYNDCGVLRIDLMHLYEFTDVHDEILRTMLPDFPALFGCKRVITKAMPFMEQRRVALILHGFIPQKAPLIGHGGIEYGSYWSKRLVNNPQA